MPLIRKVGVVLLATAVGAVAFLIYTILKSKREGDDNAKVPKVLLDPKKTYLLPLIKIDVLNNETKKFRFGLPSSEHVLGMPVGNHIDLTATINDEVVVRSYAPITCDDDKGFVDLVIQVFQNNQQFIGEMSNYLNNMQIGDTIGFSGPYGKLKYNGNGKIQITTEAKKFNMIAFGSGITPMLQLVRNIVKHTEDSTVCSLLYSNVAVNNILMRKELEQLASNNPAKFKLWYTLEEPPESWTYSRGTINEDMIKYHLFPPDENTIVLMCGPPDIIQHSCKPTLNSLGYNPDHCFTY